MLAIVTRTQGQAKSLQLRLLASCAMATSMIAGGASPVFAETPPPLTGTDVALRGIASFNPAEVSAVRTRALDTFTVNAQNTVINFTPFDTANGGGPITFLNSGATALFQSDASSTIINAPFAFVLRKRLMPFRVAAIDRLPGGRM